MSSNNITSFPTQIKIIDDDKNSYLYILWDKVGKTKGLLTLIEEQKNCQRKDGFSTARKSKY
ncbi:hypothetical protein [Kaistella antarctica]|uniref:Uncharacterized protein n=1 Tax=Kaistella antarctica TaxID=266748 RepID=A0A3S4UII7_9FLAO|nr:hypothetical protein [Kaistella antarctica]KEY20008.1 hypothetical protein HY04_01935 [Kaistella antarctica]SEV94814.1 hypothetical protein SAMN05421765_1383 [Kaistella antarctica]VEH95750.1 Uncharacterised protein [Kaistella antarctica]